MKQYDIISIGGATIDAFLRSSSTDIEVEKVHKQIDVCLPLGSKILVDQHTTEVGGSAMNASTSFAKLGLKTAVVAKLGNDLNAQLIKQTLKQNKIDFLGKTSKGSTGYSVIISGFKDRIILVHKGNNNDLQEKDVPKLKTKWLYFGTMLKQSYKTQCKLAKYAKKNKIKLAYNTSLYIARKGYKFLKPILDACDILILNKQEARALTRKNANIKTLLRDIQKHIPIIVITDGSTGAYVYNGIKEYYVKPKKVKVIDTTGAGDAFASGFVAALIHNNDIKTALKWGAAQANSILQEYGAAKTLLTLKQIKKKAPTAGRVEVR